MLLLLDRNFTKQLISTIVVEKGEDSTSSKLSSVSFDRDKGRGSLKEVSIKEVN